MEEGHDVKASLSIYMQTLDITNFTFLIKNTKVPLDCLQENNGSNIFHEIASSVAKEAYLIQYLEILISEFHDRYFEEAEEKLKRMINIPTGREKLSPIMIALSHNRRKLIKYFISLGADVKIKDHQGQGLVHLAAACGFESILVYLCREIGLGFDDLDNNERTPLHLAALEGQAGTGMLLVAWETDLNKADIEAFTPLHLSALSQCYKLSRNLLICGANPNIKDRNGETALDIAKTRNAIDIINLLEPLSCSQALNPFYHKIGPVENNYKKFVFYILLFLFRAGITITVIFPRVQLQLSLASASILIATALLFMIVSCKDPGYTRSLKNEGLLALFDNYRSEFVCVYCECRKSKLTRHCHYCQRCVKELDHHCPWVHNCIGKGNHYWFVMFIGFSVMDYAAQGVLAMFSYFRMFKGSEFKVVELNEESKFVTIGVAGISAVCLAFVLPIFFTHIKGMCKRRDIRTYSSVKPPEGFKPEESDTSSMFNRASVEWNPYSSTTQVSFLSARIGYKPGSSYCN